MVMKTITAITLEVDDTTAAEEFYSAAFGLGDRLQLRAADSPTTGFRAYTLSLLVSQPANADVLLARALDAGATTLRPAEKSMWGYGGVLRAPDGAIWKVATPKKKNTGPATDEIDDIVLLIGVDDVRTSKSFYVDHGLTVSRSFGRMYVEFDAPEGAIKFGLYRHKALAKDAGVPPEGSGSHRIAINSDAGSFTDPDGFAWERASLDADLDTSA